MDIDAIIARETTRRARMGLVSKCGIACATPAQKAYYDFRHEMRGRDDWGSLPADLEQKLIRLKKAAHAQAA